MRARFLGCERNYVNVSDSNALEMQIRIGHALSPFQTGGMTGSVLGVEPLQGALGAEFGALFMTIAHLSHSRWLFESREANKTPQASIGYLGSHARG